MTRYHVGAKDLRGAIDAYSKRFDLLELRIPAATELAGFPSVATLSKWRKTVPPTFEFVPVAGPQLSKLKPSAVFDAELELWLQTSAVTEARTLLIHTPPDVTPSQLTRDRLARLVDRVPRDACTLVWEPSGLWEVEDAAEVAARLGLCLAVDPGKTPVPPGPIAYARLRALGEVRSFGASALERVVAAIGDRREAYVVLETQTALAECKLVRRIAQGVAKTGGLRKVRRTDVLLPQGGEE